MSGVRSIPLRFKNKLSDDEFAILDSHLSNIPVKLGALAKDLGISVKVSTLKTGVSGLIQREGGIYKIKLNRYESRERQRFTLAHEISHYLLHRDLIDKNENGIVDNVLYRSGEAANVEYEANKLASCIVVPSEVLIEELEAHSDYESTAQVEILARRFEVSKAAMEIKFEELGIGD